MKNLLVRFVRDEEGQDIIEYGLLGAFISIVAIAAILGIGGDVRTMFETIDAALVPAP
jgi:Flp pilus assembly pilin Flp